eukprot:3240954-Rhodomonas_salina.2
MEEENDRCRGRGEGRGIGRGEGEGEPRIQRERPQREHLEITCKASLCPRCISNIRDSPSACSEDR